MSSRATLPYQPMAGDPAYVYAGRPMRWAGVPKVTGAMKRRIILFPIVFFQLYLTASVLTFVLGPWGWPVSNPVQLYTFLFLAQFALLFGYLSAINKAPRQGSMKIRLQWTVIVSLILNVLWVNQLYKYRTGTSTDVAGFITALVSGITNPGHQYGQKIKNYAVAAGAASTMMDYVTLLMFPILWLAFPLGIVFWNQLSARLRLFLIGWLVLDLLTWIAAGTNKGIADFVILFPCLLLARKPTILVNIKMRNVVVLGLVAVIGLAGLFTFFSMGMLGRVGGSAAMNYDPASGIAVDTDSFALRYVPADLQGPVAAFASYFSQGYYGLALSLKEPFIFCYGVGNSYLWEGLSRHLVSTPIMDRTYPARIGTSGWNLYRNWDTIYPWIASDLSFPGTIVFMFLLGRMTALVWIDVAFARNPLAVCLLPLVLTMLFYIPANNQVLAFSEAAMPFWFLLITWSFTRGRIK